MLQVTYPSLLSVYYKLLEWTGTPTCPPERQYQASDQCPKPGSTVPIDSTLFYDMHVDVCKFSYFHVRAMRHIRNHISEDTAKSIACSVIHGRLDYCNLVLYGTSAANLNKLQRAQNSIPTTQRRSLLTYTGCQSSTKCNTWLRSVLTRSSTHGQICTG